MTGTVTIGRGASSKIALGGVPQVALFGPLGGGKITNPITAADQGLSVAEPLFLDLTGPAALGETPTTILLAPGQSLDVPVGDTVSVWVNAASTGHRFSAVTFQPLPSLVPQTGSFPPVGSTTLTQTIRSYLYEQYKDDDDLQAFVAAFNGLAQQYVDWFTQVGLPVYTGDMIAGALLDWVAAGLYGMTRPALSSGRNRNLGPFNTYNLNGLGFNVIERLGPSNVVVTTDDIFKRILTWHFYKGDGKYFDVRWLKRRVMRFLIGVNGTAPPIPNTYQISVTFGVGNQINITLLNGLRTLTGGAIFNRFGLNTVPFNSLRTTFESFAPLADAAIFTEAVNSGALELPFQFNFVVNTL